MVVPPLISSRKEKEDFLKFIVASLTISPSEKDLYNICVEVLEGNDFETFFQKIAMQVQSHWETQKTSIEPLTSNFI